MSSNSSELRFESATKLAVFWLFLVFCVGLYFRFHPPQKSSAEPVPVLRISERLAVVAQYSEDLPPNLKKQLVKVALEQESSLKAKAVIRGELPESMEDSDLSGTYALMAAELKEPNAEQEQKLRELAREGRTRFFATACILTTLVSICLVTLFLPKTENHQPASPTELNSLGILGVFFAWDVVGFLALPFLASTFRFFLGRFALILLSQLALYGFMMALLNQFRNKQSLTLFRKFSWSWVGKGYFLCVATVFLVNSLLAILSGHHPQSENPILSLFVDAASWKVGLLGLLVVVVGPIFEEIMFRVWLFGGLREKWGDVGAAVMSSALFALIHGDAPALPALFCLGMVFCWVYRRSGSAYTSILVHALWNLTTFSLLISIIP